MIIIRDATRTDLLGVVELIREGAKKGLILRRTKKELNSLIHDSKIIVATHNDKLVGIAILDFYSKRLSELRSLYILDSYRGLGIGKKLINSIVDKARSMRIKELFTITLVEKKNWFEKRGFKQNPHDFKIALFKKL